MSRICKIESCVDGLKSAVADLQSSSDLDEQNLSIDGCELSISNGNSVQLPKTVYSFDIEPGIREQIWSGTDALPQDDVKNIFNGSADPVSYGTPSHPNTPTIDVIVPTWVNSTNNDPSNGTDQARFTGYFYADADGTVIGDDNANNGERYRVWLGDCCSAPKVIYESPEGDDSPFVGGAGNAIGDFYTVNQGWHLLIVECTDRAAFAGFDLTFNGDPYTGPASVSKPVLVCRQEPCDYELLDGEFECPPSACQPFAQVSEEGLSEEDVTALLPVASSAIPIADNELDAAIRSGEIGTSVDYARADHNHPIVRQTILADPVIGFGGSFTGLQSLVLDRGSDEESIWYRFRVRVSQTSGNSWGFLTVPTIAGFQQPLYSEMGGYINPSIVLQADDGVQGSTPRGPWMNYPIHHWSSTNRLYGGIFRREVDISSMYINFVVKYVRS